MRWDVSSRELTVSVRAPASRYQKLDLKLNPGPGTVLNMRECWSRASQQSGKNRLSYETQVSGLSQIAQNISSRTIRRGPVLSLLLRAVQADRFGCLAGC